MRVREGEGLEDAEGRLGGGVGGVAAAHVRQGLVGDHGLGKKKKSVKAQAFFNFVSMDLWFKNSGICWQN